MRRDIHETAIVLLLIAGLASPAVASEYQQLDWKDLIKHVEFDDPFLALTPEQLTHLSRVASMREAQARGQSMNEGSQRRAESAIQRLEADEIDIDGLLARRAEIRELREQRALGVVDDLDGRQVSMPGYALPLEFSGTKLTEFLLVPWAGACIHTPPPPPNQIVYVKSEDGIEIRGRFSPVVVMGEMSVKPASKELFLVDGTANIDVGYSVLASAVEPYEVK
jgi:hypothetical protein